MTTIAPVAKALTGAAIAGLGALGTALTDGAVSPAEWVAVVTATLTASLMVWVVPNTDPDGEHQDESVQPNMILGKAFTGGTFSSADEKRREGGA